MALVTGTPELHDIYSKIKNVRLAIEHHNLSNALLLITQLRLEMEGSPDSVRFWDYVDSLYTFIISEIIKEINKDFQHINQLLNHWHFNEAEESLQNIYSKYGTFLETQPEFNEIELKIKWIEQTLTDTSIEQSLIRTYDQLNLLIQQERFKEAEVIYEQYIQTLHTREQKSEMDFSIEHLLPLINRSHSANAKTSCPKGERLHHFVLSDTQSVSKEITAVYLQERFLPFFTAVNDFQALIDKVRGCETKEVTLKLLSQNSPISVSMDGAAETIDIFRESITPWRKQHAEVMARLAEQEKNMEIETKRAEVLEIRARAKREQAEAEKLTTEACKGRHEAERLRLENEKLQWELRQAKCEFALKMITRLNSELSESERASYLTEIMRPLNVLITSDFELSKD